MDEAQKVLVLDKISEANFRNIDGRKVFSPKDFADLVKLQLKLLKGGKKINYTIEVRDQEGGYEIVATEMEIEPDAITRSYGEKMNRGKEMARLVARYATTDENETIFLPQQLKLDSERECAPEVIDGFLHAKDKHEVSTLVEIQKQMSKSDLYLNGEDFKKVDSNANPFIVNESSDKNKSLKLLLQKIDYSGRYVKFWVSLVENGALSKLLHMELGEELSMDSSVLFPLLEHLRYKVEERKFFEVIADTDSEYEVKDGVTRTKKITVRKIKDFGLSEYPG